MSLFPQTPAAGLKLAFGGFPASTPMGVGLPPQGPPGGAGGGGLHDLKFTLYDDGKEPFFFSDGDLDYSKTTSKAFENMKKISEKYPWFPKIGLALPLSDVPKDDEGKRVRKWESDNWRVKFSTGIYLNGVDTTIAYYPRREKTFYYRPSLRIADSNSAIHYPWYERQDSEEAIFYSSLARANISSTAAGDTPSIRYRIKHALLICLYFATCIPLKFSVTGPYFVRLLARNGTIKAKRIL
jgi:hypothetical protein